MHPIVPTATAANRPLRGVYVEAERNGVTVFVLYDLAGELVRREYVRTVDVDDALREELHAWLDRHDGKGPHLTLER